MASTEQIDRATLVDEVLGRLRELLLSGEIGPGERLRMRYLQERFGVSHIPIREALRTLESEGLVENQPQRGAVATDVSLGVLSELYDVRRLLEPPIARRAAAKFTDQDLAELETALQRLERSEPELESGDFYRAHREFHRLVLQPGSTPMTERILNPLWGIAERFVRLTVATYHTESEVAHTQHRSIFEACAARDPVVGDRLLEHLHVTEDFVRAWAIEHQLVATTDS